LRIKYSVLIIIPLLFGIGFLFPYELSYASTEEDDIDWETYENSDLGYTIEYPMDLDVHDSSDDPTHVSFWNFDSDFGINIIIFNALPNNMTLTQFIDKEIKDDPLREIIGQPVDIVVGENPGKLYTTTTALSDKQFNNAVFKHDDHIYLLIVSGVETSLGKFTYDHMINSIEFE